MDMQKNGRSVTKLSCSMVITFLLFTISGCGSTSSSTPPTSTTAIRSSATSTSAPTSAPASPSASTQLKNFQGPIDFVLNNTFDFLSASGTGMVNGVTTPLNASTVKAGAQADLQHTLFIVDSNNHITVSTNTSPTPQPAQTHRNADGSTTIQYTKSSKSGATSFSGILVGNQMKATYSSETLSSTTVDNQTFSGGTNSTSLFITQVTWVPPNQIPLPPTGGHYQLTSDGGVKLSWTPGDTTSTYHIYRFVLTSDRDFQLLGNTATPAYTDESSTAQTNAQTITGIAYAVYAVGPTGIENPQDIIISVSSLG